jgi:hypothetical protein
VQCLLEQVCARREEGAEVAGARQCPGPAGVRRLFRERGRERSGVGRSACPHERLDRVCHLWVELERTGGR